MPFQGILEIKLVTPYFKQNKSLYVFFKANSVPIIASIILSQMGIFILILQYFNKYIFEYKASKLLNHRTPNDIF